MVHKKTLWSTDGSKDKRGRPSKRMQRRIVGDATAPESRFEALKKKEMNEVKSSNMAGKLSIK